MSELSDELANRLKLMSNLLEGMHISDVSSHVRNVGISQTQKLDRLTVSDLWPLLYKSKAEV